MAMGELQLPFCGRPIGSRSPDAPAADRRKTIEWAAIALVAGSAACGTLLWRPRPLLLWNASSSSPIGLYSIGPRAGLRRGDVAVAWAPAWARRLADRRNYLPSPVPLVKRVAGAEGDRVCAVRRHIFVNGRLAALRRSRDPEGRPMPWWSGCRSLGRGELFLLSRGVPEAFDGRYFGVTRATDLVGKATLLWGKPAERSSDG
jgi:conjugative transfer signal peptidase TraF